MGVALWGRDKLLKHSFLCWLYCKQILINFDSLTLFSLIVRCLVSIVLWSYFLFVEHLVYCSGVISRLVCCHHSQLSASCLASDGLALRKHKKLNLLHLIVITHKSFHGWPLNLWSEIYRNETKVGWVIYRYPNWPSCNLYYVTYERPLISLKLHYWERVCNVHKHSLSERREAAYLLSPVYILKWSSEPAFLP